MKTINILATDTETTGLKMDRHNAISIALVTGQKQYEVEGDKVIVNPDISDIGEYYTLINWGKIINGFEIPKETTEVHGITNEELATGPNPIQAYSECYKFLVNWIEKVRNNGENDNDTFEILNGFNVTFDLNMFNYDMLEIIQYMDRIHNFRNAKVNPNDQLFKNDIVIDFTEEEESNTRKLANLFRRGNIHKPVLMEKGSLLVNDENKNFKVIDSIIIDRMNYRVDNNGIKLRHSLEQCSLRYGIDLDENAHNALSDTLQTLDTFNSQFNEFNNTLDGIYYGSMKEFKETKLKHIVDEEGKPVLDEQGYPIPPETYEIVKSRPEFKTVDMNSKEYEKELSAYYYKIEQRFRKTEARPYDGC